MNHKNVPIQLCTCTLRLVVGSDFPQQWHCGSLRRRRCNVMTHVQGLAQGPASLGTSRALSAEQRLKPSHVEVFRADGRCGRLFSPVRHARQPVIRAAVEPSSNTKFTINTPGAEGRSVNCPLPLRICMQEARQAAMIG